MQETLMTENDRDMDLSRCIRFLNGNEEAQWDWLIHHSMMFIGSILSDFDLVCVVKKRGGNLPWSNNQWKMFDKCSGSILRRNEHVDKRKKKSRSVGWEYLRRMTQIRIHWSTNLNIFVLDTLQMQIESRVKSRWAVALILTTIWCLWHVGTYRYNEEFGVDSI